MNIQPIVSLIIPVHNTEKYLSETMCSVCSQDLQELEIICVDDCSTDSSLDILRDFASHDSRVRIIINPQNIGAARTRRRGLLESSGEFIMFADSDDMLQKNCCSRALELIRKCQCDILQFNIRTLNDGVMSDTAPTFAPYAGRLEKSPLIEPWLFEIKFAHTLWGKIYRGDICRKAAQQMSDNVYPCALDDFYTFFAISYLATSYCGIPSEYLYIYRENIGISSGPTSTLRSVNLLPAFEDFIRRNDTCGSEHRFINGIANRLYDCGLAILLKIRRLEPAMLEEAFRCWGQKILLDFIARIGVFNVETGDRNYILPRLVSMLQQQNTNRKN